MAVGLGTGSTVAHLLPALAARGLRSSLRRDLGRDRGAGRELGIPVEPFDELDRLDIAIDGADQVAPDGWLVKGGGGAHTREKIVAAAAERFIVIADSSKTGRPDHGADPARAAAFGLASTLARIAGSSARSRCGPTLPQAPTTA